MDLVQVSTVSKLIKLFKYSSCYVVLHIVLLSSRVGCAKNHRIVESQFSL